MTGRLPTSGTHGKSTESLLPGIRPIIVAAHPRSGTHLLIDLLRRQFRESASWKYWGERNDRLYLTLDTAITGKPSRDLSKAVSVLKRVPRPVIKTHYLPGFDRGFFADQSTVVDGPWREIIDRSQIIYVYRDGRDVLRSLHAFMASFDKAVRVSFPEFLRQEHAGQNRVIRWAKHVTEWRHQPDVFFVSYEAIIADTSCVLRDLAAFLQMEPLYDKPLLPPRMRGVWHSRWNRAFRMKPESTAIVARGRFHWGTEGRWQQTYTPEELEYFCTQAGATLQGLGYPLSACRQNGSSCPRA